MARKPPVQGDLIKVEWFDICEDSTGDPNAARCLKRISYGLFWAHEIRTGIDCLVTTTTMDDDGGVQSGWCCYPWGVVKDITVIKRHK